MRPEDLDHHQQCALHCSKVMSIGRTANPLSTVASFATYLNHLSPCIRVCASRRDSHHQTLRSGSRPSPWFRVVSRTRWMRKKRCQVARMSQELLFSFIHRTISIQR
uniref:Uncharacterized protein n=1 Tax=Anopheles albimanus TaxID=7167 RepID=A0A182FYW5_ANOAL